MNRAAKAPRRAEGNRSFLRPKTSLCGPEAPFRFVLNRLPGRLSGRLPSIRRCFAPDFFLHPVPYASVRPDSPCSPCSVRSSGFGPLRSRLVCLPEVRLRLVSFAPSRLIPDCAPFRSPCLQPVYGFFRPVCRISLLPRSVCGLPRASRLIASRSVPSPLSRPVSFALPCLALVRFFSPVRSSCKKVSKKLESRKNSIYL